MRVDGWSPGRGFSLPELLVSLVLVGVLGIAITRTSLRVLRHQGWLGERVEVDASLRAALAFLEREFWPLAAAGVGGGDILEGQESSIRYRSMRGLYIVCAPPDYAAARVVLRQVVRDLAPLDPDRDSLFLLVESIATDGGNEQWLRAEMGAIDRRSSCADGSPGVAVTLTGPLHSSRARVRVGSPVRPFEIRWLRLYRDSRGDRWLGERRWKRTTGWSRTQPIAGPLAPRGLRFVYRDRNGSPAAGGSDIYRIDIELRGATRQGRGDRRRAERSTATVATASIALRNNRR